MGSISASTSRRAHIIKTRPGFRNGQWANEFRWPWSDLLSDLSLGCYSVKDGINCIHAEKCVESKLLPLVENMGKGLGGESLAWQFAIVSSVVLPGGMVAIGAWAAEKIELIRVRLCLPCYCRN